MAAMAAMAAMALEASRLLDDLQAEKDEEVK